MEKLFFNGRREAFKGRLIRIVYCMLCSCVCLLCFAVSSPAAPKNAPAEASQNWQPEWNRLVAEAKKEGSVLFYTISGVGTKEVGKAFKDKFGVNVDIMTASAPELASRLTTEYSRGIFNADVINTGGGSHHTVLKPAGIPQRFAQALLLPEVTDPKAWRLGRVPFVDADRTFLSMTQVLEPLILYNTDLVKKRDFSSVQDLLKPQWKGKIVMVDPSAPGTTLAGTVFLTRLWGAEKAKDFLIKLSGQEPAMTRDPRQAVEWVARGKYHITFAPQPESVSQFMVLASPIAYADIEEGALLETTTGGLAMPSKPAHPNASKLFINWLLTKEGQTLWVKTVKMPGTRVDVTTEGVPPVLIAKPGEKYMPDNEDYYLLMGKTRDSNKEIFAKQLK